MKKSASKNQTAASSQAPAPPAAPQPPAEAAGGPAQAPAEQGSTPAPAPRILPFVNFQQRQENRALSTDKVLDLLRQWMPDHHEELKNLIVNTAALRTEVDKILAADHAAMLGKLDDIQTIVATLLSRVDEFRGLSLAVVPNADLSEQAIWILRQFVQSGDETLFYASYGPGQFCLQPDNGEPFTITDLRFLRNDLEQLVTLGLFNVRYNSEGNPLFGLTRNGLRYLEAIDGTGTAAPA